jgi:hypothetical protein
MGKTNGMKSLLLAFLGKVHFLRQRVREKSMKVTEMDG